ncbi:uncharacterized protein METZ01_LOCUS279105 [marine metagenome]|uniref:Uncharacterized protein n=1 Tax=marine metagenome TaxID=408172 RepID=A0A382KUD8_9ZZZZ
MVEDPIFSMVQTLRSTLAKYYASLDQMVLENPLYLKL